MFKRVISQEQKLKCEITGQPHELSRPLLKVILSNIYEQYLKYEQNLNTFYKCYTY